MKYTREQMIRQYEAAFEPYKKRKDLHDIIIDNWRKHFNKLKSFNNEDFNNVANKYK